MDPRFFGDNLVAYEQVQDDGRRRSSGRREDAWYKRQAPASVGFLRITSAVIAAVAFILAASAADAAVDLLKVPVVCGPIAEVLDNLAPVMPDREVIATGGDGEGKEIVTLFTGNGYWALIARMPPQSACVVASGRNWTGTEPGEAESW